MITTRSSGNGFKLFLINLEYKILYRRNLSSLEPVCTLAQYQDWEHNDDIYPAMQACSAPCTRVSFRVSQVKYRSRGDSVAFDCGSGYSSVIQLVFGHQATWEKVGDTFTFQIPTWSRHRQSTARVNITAGGLCAAPGDAALHPGRDARPLARPLSPLGRAARTGHARPARLACR